MAIKKSGVSGKRGSPRKSTAGPAGTKIPFAAGANLPAEAGAEQLQAGTEAEIRRRAYELYEARGRQEGFDRDDWTQAEAEVLSRLRKKGTA